jgi:hypothetical protein
MVGFQNVIVIVNEYCAYAPSLDLYVAWEADCQWVSLMTVELTKLATSWLAICESFWHGGASMALF